MGISTTTTITCKARQVSDQMSCDRCGLVWDMNDPDPPVCKTDAEIANEGPATIAQKIKDRRLGADRRRQTGINALKTVRETLKS